MKTLILAYLRRPTHFLLIAIFALLLVAAQPVNAQEAVNITQGKLSFRPVVKNNRILWFEYAELNQTAGRVSVWVYENGANKLITNDASVFFPGWPDMDDDGNVVYMRNVGTSHQVFLYQGGKETQITNNPVITNSKIDMGLGSARVYTGFARIHGGNVVFKNWLGHIYHYQNSTKTVRMISNKPAETANLGDDDGGKASTGVSAPLNAHVKYFEFDDKHIVWMHEDRLADNNAKVSIYMAKAADKFLPQVIAEFDAWVPNDKATLPGKIWNPFFRACNGSVIWQYLMPAKAPPLGANMLRQDYGANLDDVRVGFYSGMGLPLELSRGTHVAAQSVRITAGRAAWWQNKKEGEGKTIKKFEEVIAYQNGGKETVARYPEPSPQGNVGDTFWDGIHDVEIAGDDIFWVMGQKECFQQFKMPVTNQPYCMFRPTPKIGFFRRSSGTSSPFRATDTKTFAGGGELDRGLYAFMSNRSVATRDITATTIYGDDSATASNLLTIIDRKRPDARKWRTDEPQRKEVTDAFSIGYDSIAACGESVGAAEVTLESFTLDVSVEKSPTARFEDIQSVALHADENGNGVLDAADKLLGKRNSPVPAEVIFTFSGDGIKIARNVREYFLVEMEIKDEVCPCGKYTVSISGEKLGIKRQAGSPVTATGKTIGGVIMPEAEVKEVTGNEQASLPLQILPEKLVVVFKNFPVRCGKIRFTMASGPPQGGGGLLNTRGYTVQELVLDPVQIGKDAKAEATFVLGREDGVYTAIASIVMAGGMACDGEQLFREHAGKMVVQVLDLNDPNYYTATADKSNPDFDTWKATMTGDIDKLSLGGDGREGAVADGASMLLIRAKLLGFADVPEGNIDVSISGEENIGHLSKGLGEQIPSYTGGTIISTQWVKTKAGIYAFALYTPPKNFGYKAKNITAPANNRQFDLKVTYRLPRASNPVEHKQKLAVYKPSVALIHGLWSGPETWGTHFTQNTWNAETQLIDYSHLNSRSFAELGAELHFGIKDILKNLRRRKIAATRVNVVGHSMGGLVSRQYVADEHGRRHFRQDNFGKGDIYKLVTLGTPHYGSPLAWLLVKLRDGQYSPFLFLVRQMGAEPMLQGGAVDAMCPGSRDIEALGVTNVPTRTVRAWNFDSRSDAVVEWDTLAAQLLLTDPKKFGRATPMGLSLAALKYGSYATGSVLVSSLYSADRTDMLVTLDSQSGGIAQGANDIFEKTIHFDTGTDLSPRLYSETLSKSVADHIFDILNRDYDDINYFAPKLPAPQVQDPARSCPRKP